MSITMVNLNPDDGQQEANNKIKMPVHLNMEFTPHTVTSVVCVEYRKGTIYDRQHVGRFGREVPGGRCVCV